MNRLDTARRTRVIAALVEGCSIRATGRMTGAAKNTIIELLEDVGTACANYQDEHLRGLTSRRLECDEIWSFCHAKKKNVAPEHRGILGYGDVWTWVAIDADTKLVPCWHVGHRARASSGAVHWRSGEPLEASRTTDDGRAEVLLGSCRGRVRV